MNARSLLSTPLYDMFDQFGQPLAVDIDHTAAVRKADELMAQPDWLGDIVIRNQRAKPLRALGNRLWLFSHSMDNAGPVTVDVQGPFGAFKLTLEQALRRIDHFHPHDQYRLRAGVERHFGVGPAQVDHTRHTNVTAAPARRTTKRTEKESQ